MEDAEPKPIRPKSSVIPTKILFNDFDYINPLTNLPEGSKLGEYDDKHDSPASLRKSKKMFGKLMN